VGAAYLVYLGIKSFFSRGETSFALDEKQALLSYRRIFVQGVITNILNPKVALFFLAFLPQFIDVSARNAAGSILLLGIWFDIGGTLVNVIVAVVFGKMGNWLSRSPRYLRVQQKITGFMLIALGIKVAFTSKK